MDIAAGKSDRVESHNSSKRNRGLLSCTECHRRKQKCNREKPCNDCTQRNVPQLCRYQSPRTNQGPYSVRGGSQEASLRRIINGNEVLLTTESIADLQRSPRGEISLAQPSLQHNQYHARFTPPSMISKDGTTRGGNPWFLGGLDPFSALPDIDGEPIPRNTLLTHFLRRLAPWLSNYDDTLTPASPRVSWLPFALNHAPLFYATCLASVVHLDRFQPLGDPRRLLWYKVETMRLANESMSVPSEGASDQMIIVALILLYFNVGGANAEEYEIHLKGIHQMIKVRGGLQNLGMRGMVKNWLDICYGPWNEDWEYGHFSSGTIASE